MADQPSRLVIAADGTPIALFSTGDGPPLILVHGATADHTTFRVVGPLLARALPGARDRSPRPGRLGRPRRSYGIEREFEDVAAVAEALASEVGRPVDVVGHSYGGRCALGAALRTDAARRVVSYEGAPTPPGTSYHPPGIETRLRDLLAAGDRDGSPRRVHDRGRRDARGGASPRSGRTRSGRCAPPRRARSCGNWRPRRTRLPRSSASARSHGPSCSCSVGRACRSSATRPTHSTSGSADGRIVVIDGARHAAHHTHPDAFVSAIRTFLA